MYTIQYMNMYLYWEWHAEWHGSSQVAFLMLWDFIFPPEGWLKLTCKHEFLSAIHIQWLIILFSFSFRYFARNLPIFIRVSFLMNYHVPLYHTSFLDMTGILFILISCFVPLQLMNYISCLGDNLSFSYFRCLCNLVYHSLTWCIAWLS